MPPVTTDTALATAMNAVIDQLVGNYDYNNIDNNIDNNNNIEMRDGAKDTNNNNNNNNNDDNSSVSSSSSAAASESYTDSTKVSEEGCDRTLRKKQPQHHANGAVPFQSWPTNHHYYHKPIVQQQQKLQQQNRRGEKDHRSRGQNIPTDEQLMELQTTTTTMEGQRQPIGTGGWRLHDVVWHQHELEAIKRTKEGNMKLQLLLSKRHAVNDLEQQQWILKQQQEQLRREELEIRRIELLQYETEQLRQQCVAQENQGTNHRLRKKKAREEPPPTQRHRKEHQQHQQPQQKEQPAKAAADTPKPKQPTGQGSVDETEDDPQTSTTIPQHRRLAPNAANNPTTRRTNMQGGKSMLHGTTKEYEFWVKVCQQKDLEMKTAMLKIEKLEREINAISNGAPVDATTAKDEVATKMKTKQKTNANPAPTRKAGSKQTAKRAQSKLAPRKRKRRRPKTSVLSPEEIKKRNEQDLKKAADIVSGMPPAIEDLNPMGDIRTFCLDAEELFLEEMPKLTPLRKPRGNREPSVVDHKHNETLIAITESLKHASTSAMVLKTDADHRKSTKKNRNGKKRRRTEDIIARDDSPIAWQLANTEESNFNSTKSLPDETKTGTADSGREPYFLSESMAVTEESPQLTITLPNDTVNASKTSIDDKNESSFSPSSHEIIEQTVLVMNHDEGQTTMDNGNDSTTGSHGSTNETTTMSTDTQKLPKHGQCKANQRKGVVLCEGDSVHNQRSHCMPNDSTEKEIHSTSPGTSMGISDQDRIEQNQPTEHKIFTTAGPKLLIVDAENNTQTRGEAAALDATKCDDSYDSDKSATEHVERIQQEKDMVPSDSGGTFDSKKFGDSCISEWNWKKLIHESNTLGESNWDSVACTCDTRRRCDFKRWSAMYIRLVEYKRKHGTTNVSPKHEDPRVVHWVKRQRVANQRGKCCPKRKNILDALGFDWTPRTSWDTMFSHLKRYYLKYRTTRVSRPKEKEFFLGVPTERDSIGNEKKKTIDSKISSDDSNENVGDGDGDRTKPSSATNRSKDTNENISDSDKKLKCSSNESELSEGCSDREYPNLRLWVFRQRSFYHKKLLPEDKIKKLNEIGFVWDGTKADAMQMRKEAEEFEMYTRKQQDHEVECGPFLVDGLSHQGGEYEKTNAFHKSSN